ncbi:MAG: hypothetical protein ACRYFX_30975 [Janthinobacterium lividum]
MPEARQAAPSQATARAAGAFLHAGAITNWSRSTVSWFAPR